MVAVVEGARLEGHLQTVADVGGVAGQRHRVQHDALLLHQVAVAAESARCQDDGPGVHLQDRPVALLGVETGDRPVAVHDELAGARLRADLRAVLLGFRLHRRDVALGRQALVPVERGHLADPAVVVDDAGELHALLDEPVEVVARALHLIAPERRVDPVVEEVYLVGHDLRERDLDALLFLHVAVHAEHAFRSRAVAAHVAADLHQNRGRAVLGRLHRGRETRDAAADDGHVGIDGFGNLVGVARPVGGVGPVGLPAARGRAARHQPRERRGGARREGSRAEPSTRQSLRFVHGNSLLGSADSCPRRSAGAVRLHANDKAQRRRRPCGRLSQFWMEPVDSAIPRLDGARSTRRYAFGFSSETSAPSTTSSNSCRVATPTLR